MATNDISAYAGVKGAREYDGVNGDHYILVYNSLGAILALGACYEVLWSDDATLGYFPILLLPATQATVMHTIGVVSNDLTLDGTIPVASWGRVQTKGYCEKVLSTTNVVDQHTITTTNGTTAITDTGGATVATNTIGIAKGARTGAGLFPAYLFGRLVAMP